MIRPSLHLHTFAAAALLAACGGAERITPPLAPFSVATDTTRIQAIAPGVREMFRWEVAGPFAIHVLEVDLAVCGVTVRSIKAGEQLEGRETTLALASRLAMQQQRPVYGAVNADFFTATGMIVGAQVADGDVVRAGTNRPIVGVTRQRSVAFGADAFSGTLRTRTRRVDIGRVNERPDTLRVALYNRYIGASTPPDAGTVSITTQTLRLASGVGDTTYAIVTRIDSIAAGVPVAPNGTVFSGRGLGATLLRANMAVGDTVSWVLLFRNMGLPIAEVVAGDPQLLRESRSLEPFAWVLQRDPRTAVGVTADNKLLLVTVDGRQAGYSVGMTLPELTALFMRLGARDALNLDGGGSTTMVVKNSVLNRPSDATGQRAVGNALAVIGPVPGTCGT